MTGVQWIRLYTSFFDNRKVRMIRSQPDGDRIVLFYLYLLTTAGKCNAGGEVFFSEKKPYNAFILSQEFGCTKEFVERAMKYLTTMEMVSWDEETHIIRILDWEAHQNAEGLEKLRETSRQSSKRYREKKKQEKALEEGDVSVTSRDEAEKNRTEEEQKRIDVNIVSTVPEHRSAPVLMLPLTGNQEYPVYQEDIDSWKDTYPNVDILQELKEMREWCNANPQKRKTSRGIRTFIINWLAKEQDKGSNTAKGKTEKPIRKFIPTEFDI